MADIIEKKSDNEDEAAAYSDVDLFEDIENEMNKALLSRQSVPNCTSRSSTLPVKSHCASPEAEPKPVEGSSSEEDFWKELRSPSSSLASLDKVKKRSRCDSPLVDNSDQLYTGTQAAEILETHYAGGDVQYVKKAIKKQKLDCSDFIQTHDLNNDCEMDVDNLNAEGDSVNKWCDDGDDALFNISYNVNPHHQSGFVTPKSNLVKSRRSVSTPNLSIIDPDPDLKSNDSPFYNNQQNLGNEIDPFWDACDDSVFANIPDEMLMKAKTPKNGNGTNHCLRKTTAAPSCASQKSLTPISHTRRRLSPKNLSRYEDEESLSTTTTTKKGNKTGRGNGRAKAPPKIKLPRKLQSTKNVSQFESDPLANDDSSQSQQDTIKSQPPPPHPLAESTNSNSKSPMLNYSLIDTPILKVCLMFLINLSYVYWFH